MTIIALRFLMPVVMGRFLMGRSPIRALTRYCEGRARLAAARGLKRNDLS
jgi:hypothetical protein